MYNPGALSEAETAEKDTSSKGRMVETEVTQILEGRVRDFVRDFEKYKRGSKGKASMDDPAIRVITSFKAALMITLPKDNIVTQKSFLGRWKRTYGDYPKVGQKVKAICNNRGYYDIYLEG